MKVTSYIGLAVGLIIMTGLIAWQGATEIASLLFTSGWTLLWVPIIWIPSILMNARCWQILFAPGYGPTFRQAFLAQWMGRAVNTLLPVASIGGEIVKARTLILWGVNAAHASASAIVDKTIQALTTILWGTAGTILLAHLALDNKLAFSILVGVSVIGMGIAGFIIIQKAGMFSLIVKSVNKFTQSEFFANLIKPASDADQTVKKLYKLHSRIALATIWRLVALISQTGEVWLAAYLLGHPISIIEAMLLKSLSSTLSDFAFVVPNSYGVQEGSFIILGELIGLTPDVSLAISLTIRIRELLIDVPGLALWQHNEGRFFLLRRRSKKSQDILD